MSLSKWKDVKFDFREDNFGGKAYLFGVERNITFNGYSCKGIKFCFFGSEGFVPFRATVMLGERASLFAIFLVRVVSSMLTLMLILKIEETDV